MTEQQALILRIASGIYKHEAVRDRHIHEQLGWTTVRFWYEVTVLLTDPAVEAAAPTEVRRLRRVREQRAAVRSARRLREDQAAKSRTRPGP